MIFNWHVTRLGSNFYWVTDPPPEILLDQLVICTWQPKPQLKIIYILNFQLQKNDTCIQKKIHRYIAEISNDLYQGDLLPSSSQKNSHLNFENLSESLANKLAILMLSPCWLRWSWSFTKASSCANVPRPSMLIQIFKNSSKNVGNNSCASKTASNWAIKSQKWEGKAGRKFLAPYQTLGRMFFIQFCFEITCPIQIRKKEWAKYYATFLNS